ncbi:hypothetical protein SIID45300_00216 [Candidatus Magnetaquicoccaceae bacterium FCR-1]|uniref:ATP-grasp domain-containing protein n=1 Tax=Candidatus Magnetaquiglobus chichijimensis TaxID=3141448 RepID=A0ABQ0C4W4_9PROT
METPNPAFVTITQPTVPPESARPGVLGPLGPAQLTCLRSWRKLGLQPLFVHLTPGNGTPGWPGTPGHHLPIPRDALRTSAGQTRLRDFLTANRCAGLTCLGEGDARLLRAIEPELPCPLWLPSQRSLDFLDAKSRQAELARACGFAVLPTWHADRDHLPLIPAGAFPVVARPDGSGSAEPMFKIKILHTPAALTTWLGSFRKLDRPVLLQPFIDGPNLVIHAATDANGTPFALAAFLVRRKFEGVTLTLEPAPLDPSLRAACTAFCQGAGLHGCLHFELLLDPRDATPWFLEVNGRLGGTTGKVHLLGFDEPRLLLSAHGVLPYPPAAGTPQDGVVCNRLALTKLLLAMARQDPDLAHDPSGLPRTWRDLLTGFLLWRDEIFRRDDPRVTLWYLRDWLADRLDRSHR